MELSEIVAVGKSTALAQSVAAGLCYIGVLVDQPSSIWSISPEVNLFAESTMWTDFCFAIEVCCDC